MTRLDRNLDDGFTLIELVIYSMLLVLIVVVVGTLMFTTLTTERNVRSVLGSSSTAQVAADTIAKTVRDSSGFSVSANGLVLKARIAGGTGDTVVWSCAYWAYSSADKTLRYLRSTTGLTDATIASGLNSWAVIASGVAAPAAGVFAKNDKQLNVDLSVLPGSGRSATRIQTSAFTRAGSETGATCF